MSGPTAWPAWQQLQRLAQASPPSLGLLLHDPTRKPLIWQAAGVALHASHQPVTAAVLAALQGLAEQAQVLPQARAMAQGAMVNHRGPARACHVALRTLGCRSRRGATRWIKRCDKLAKAFLRTADRTPGQWLGANGGSPSSRGQLGYWWLRSGPP